MAVTIKDVAREARVSVASVSRALNGSANVTEITRRRIIGVAERLRYVPHSAARSLITRRTQTVGALLPDLFGEFFSELIRGIDLAARARGLHLLVSSSHGHPSEAAAALRAMQGRVDGVLVMSPHVDAAFLSDHLWHALPAVLINTPLHDSQFTTINIDNYGGAFAMTQHLIARGFRSIAFVTGPDANFDASERLRGFNDAVARSENAIDARILHGDFTEESGYRVGKRFVRIEIASARGVRGQRHDGHRHAARVQRERRARSRRRGAGRLRRHSHFTFRKPAADDGAGAHCGSRPQRARAAGAAARHARCKWSGRTETELRHRRARIVRRKRSFDGGLRKPERGVFKT